MPVLLPVTAAARKLRAVPEALRSVRSARRSRRTPTGFRFVLADHIGGLRPDHWDALVADRGVCLSRAYLETLQAHGPEALRGHYALIYRGEQPVAAVACQSLDIDASKLAARKEGGPGAPGLTRLQQRVLVCGNVLGWGPQGLAFAPDESPEMLWPAVAEALYRIRRADKLFGETGLVMVKDLPQDDATAGPALRPFSYRPFDTEPDMVLPLDPRWDSFEAYLAALKSDYRSGVKKQLRDVEAAGLVVERLEAAGVAARAAELHGLYLQIHEKQKMRLVTLPETWLPALAARFPSDFRCAVIRRPESDRLVGFITTLRDADGAIGYLIGFDKATAAQGVPLYLRLLYAMVEDAIALGARWVSLGRTALEPKAKLGAQPRPLRCYLRHRIPALNAVVRGLLHALPDPAQAPARSPFKPTRE